MAKKKNATIQTNPKCMYYKYDYCTMYFGMRICVEVYIHSILILLFIRRKRETGFGVLLSLFIIYMCTTCNMYLIYVKADKFWREKKC